MPKYKIPGKVSWSPSWRNITVKHGWMAQLYKDNYNDEDNLTRFKLMYARILHLKLIWKYGGTNKQIRVDAGSDVLCVAGACTGRQGGSNLGRGKQNQGRRVYAGTNGGELQLWELDAREKATLVHKRVVSNTGVKCVCAAGDGDLDCVFYTTYTSGDLVALDPVNWQEIARGSWHTDTIWSLSTCLHQDLVLGLVTGGMDGQICLGWLSGRRLLLEHSLQVFSTAVSCVATVGTGGGWMAAGSDDGLVVVYHRDYWRDVWDKVASGRGHVGSVTGVALTPQVIVTVSLDCTAKVWRLCNLQPLAELISSNVILPSLRCVSLHGYHLVVGDMEGKVHFWDLEPIHSKIQKTEKEPMGIVELEVPEVVDDETEEKNDEPANFKDCDDVVETRSLAVHGNKVVCVWTDGELIFSGGRDQRLVIEDLWSAAMKLLLPDIPSFRRGFSRDVPDQVTTKKKSKLILRRRASQPNQFIPKNFELIFLKSRARKTSSPPFLPPHLSRSLPTSLKETSLSSSLPSTPTGSSVTSAPTLSNLFLSIPEYSPSLLGERNCVAGEKSQNTPQPAHAEKTCNCLTLEKPLNTSDSENECNQSTDDVLLT